jgi:hypothetical protein
LVPSTVDLVGAPVAEFEFTIAVFVMFSGGTESLLFAHSPELPGTEPATAH